VLALSTRIETVRRMNLLFGVRAAQSEHWESLRRLLDDCALLAREVGVARSGELIAITAGIPSQELGTNLEMPNELPPGPPAVSPPPPASASEQVTPATDAGE